MRISNIPQIYRHLNRWGEIVAVLSKYELASWIGRLGPGFAKDLLKARGGAAIARLPWETRVRMALAELGPTFIKLGQVLSTRPDLVGVAMADDLRHLQDDVPADPPEVVRKTIESELGRPVEELFAEFDDRAMASASIGQVHRARLPTGESVVVKVQRADIQKKIAVDLDILAGLAQLAERIPEFQNYRPRAVAAEFQRTLRRELDFAREQLNLQEFARQFQDNPFVHIPWTYPEWCTSRVLTMEFIDGIKLSEPALLREAGVDAEEVARRGAEICLEMIFEHGFYHADPHPGNILVMPGNVIGLLDFGMVGRLDERLHDQIGEMLVAVSNQDAEYLATLILRLTAPPANLDHAAFSLDVADFMAHYAGQSLDRLDLSGALNEGMENIRRHHIMMPARIAMLLKALITLEGTSRLVNPKFSLIEVMKPYRKTMILRRFSPSRQYRKARRFYREVEHLVEVLPQGIIDVLEQVESGKFDVHLDHRGLEPSVNRLVLGMLASALFLGSALLLAHNVGPSMLGMSSLGFAGCTVSIIIGMRLWRAINKSGHLDRRKEIEGR
jgi:ubiquinone biosynthesis protein